MTDRFQVPDKEGGPGPTSMLEVYMHAIQSPVGDDFLDKSNLGLGNYGHREYWQQIQSFRNGLYADAGMSRRLIERAIYETKREMAKAAFRRPDQVDFTHRDPEQFVEKYIDDNDLDEDYDELRCDEVVEEAYVEEYMDEFWNNLGDEETPVWKEQARMVEQYAGFDKNWVPPHWRMLKMRHEASRSKGARLIDNLFERVREVKDTTMESVGLE